MSQEKQPADPKESRVRPTQSASDLFKVSLPGKLRPQLDPNLSSFGFNTPLEMQDAPPAFVPGNIVDGKYKLLRPIGKGGMGLVWLVEHNMLKIELALKTLINSRMNAVNFQRFAKEIAAASKFDHQNLIKVYDCGILPDGIPYFTMEYIQGPTLKKFLEDHGPLTLNEGLEVFLQVASALGYAHRHNTVHRDIKPENIILTKQNNRMVPIVLDFGLAKFVHSGLMPVSESTAGDFIGSPPYMSPEQCMGKEVSEKSDIYSLGCTIFEALTGTTPFRAEHHLGLLQKHISESPPSLRQASGGEVFPEALEVLVARMLAKDPEKRCRSMEEVERLIKLLIKGKLSTSQTPYLSDTDAEKDLQDANSPNFTALIITALALVLVAGLAFTVYFFSEPQKRESKGGQTEQQESDYFPTPFSEADPDSPDRIVFHFPNKKSYGTMAILPDRGSQPCINDLKFPISAPISFRPSEHFFEKPERLHLFGPNQLTGLVLNSPYRVSNSVMAEIASWKKLAQLEIINCAIDDKGLEFIENNNSLEILTLKNIAVSGTAISKLKCLSHVKVLDIDSISSTNDFDLVLQKLRNSPYIIRLGLRCSNLHDADLDDIATMKQLQELYLSNNDLSSQGLAKLSRLHNLRDLRLTGINLDPSVISTLRSFPNLKTLHINTKKWPREKVKELNEALPNCEFSAS
ncbi:MAG: protein kinase [Candidatus Obscuribacterales bacterium]|nr:protein kinase [Candidatus Obscuribacterales bacterium]